MGRFYKTAQPTFVEDKMYKPNLDLLAMLAETEVQTDALKKSFASMSEYESRPTFGAWGQDMDNEIAKVNNLVQPIVEQLIKDPNSIEAQKQLRGATNSIGELFSSGRVGQMASYYSEYQSYIAELKKRASEIKDDDDRANALQRISDFEAVTANSLGDHFEEGWRRKNLSPYVNANTLLKNNIDTESLLKTNAGIGVSVKAVKINGEYVPINSLKGTYNSKDGTFTTSDDEDNPHDVVNVRDSGLKSTGLLPYQYFRDDETIVGYDQATIQNLAVSELLDDESYMAMIGDNYNMFEDGWAEKTDDEGKVVKYRKTLSEYLKDKVLEDADNFASQYPTIISDTVTRTNLTDDYGKQSALKAQDHSYEVDMLNRRQANKIAIEELKDAKDRRDHINKLMIRVINGDKKAFAEYNYLKAISTIGDLGFPKETFDGDAALNQGSRGYYQSGNSDSKLETNDPAALQRMKNANLSAKNKMGNKSIPLLFGFGDLQHNDYFDNKAMDSLFESGDDSGKKAMHLLFGPENYHYNDYFNWLGDRRSTRDLSKEWLTWEYNKVGYKYRSITDEQIKSSLKGFVNKDEIFKKIVNARDLYSKDPEKFVDSFINAENTDGMSLLENVTKVGKDYDGYRDEWYKDYDQKSQEYNLEPLDAQATYQEYQQIKQNPTQFTITDEEGNLIAKNPRDEIISHFDLSHPLYTTSANMFNSIGFQTSPTRGHYKGRKVWIFPNDVTPGDNHESDANTRLVTAIALKGMSYTDEKNPTLQNIRAGLLNNTIKRLSIDLHRAGEDGYGGSTVIENIPIDGGKSVIPVSVQSISFDANQVLIVRDPDDPISTIGLKYHTVRQLVSEFFEMDSKSPDILSLGEE